MAKAKILTDRGKTYILKDYKETKTIEVIVKMQQISNKWELDKEIPYDKHPTSDTPIKIMLEYSSGINAIDYFIDKLNLATSEKEKTEWFELISSQRKNLNRSMAPEYWKVWLAPPLCFRKAFWPA